jgi:hypothetical protein
MAILENNTTYVSPNQEFMGKPLEFVSIEFGENVSTKTAKDSTLDLAEKTLQIYANIVGSGPLFDGTGTTSKKTYMTEAVDALVGSPASAGGSFTLTTSSAGSSAATLLAAIKALGTVDSVNLNDGGTTAVIKNLAI